MTDQAKRWARAAMAAALAVGATATLDIPRAAAQAAPGVKLGIVTFLSGPAAGPFGIPSRNAAELVTEAINKGEIPAPYNSKGLAGASIEAKFVDEAGPVTKVVHGFPQPGPAATRSTPSSATSRRAAASASRRSRRS